MDDKRSRAAGPEAGRLGAPWPSMAWPAEPPREEGSPAGGPSGPERAAGARQLLPPPPEPAPGRGAPAKAAWLALPGAVVAIALASVGTGIGQSLTGSTKGAVTTLLGELGLWAGMLGTVVVVSRVYGTGSLARDFGLRLTRSDLPVGALAAVAAVVVSEVVLVAFAGTKFSGTNEQILTQQQGHEVGLLVVALMVAVGAPFFEELFFRGYLRTAFQSGVGAHPAVWLQAGFFALAHYGEAKGLGNVSLLLAMFGVGAVLGYTAKVTRRLGAGMVAHCLFNLLAVVLVVA